MQGMSRYSSDFSSSVNHMSSHLTNKGGIQVSLTHTNSVVPSRDVVYVIWDSHVGQSCRFNVVCHTELGRSVFQEVIDSILVWKIQLSGINLALGACPAMFDLS